MSKYDTEEILNRYWQELDLIMERLYTGVSNQVEKDKGRVENAAYFIAILENPNAPNIIDVIARAKQKVKEALG